MMRSHLAAVSTPSLEGDRVLVFGGGRYFTGAYFHDILELRRLITFQEAATPPSKSSLWQRLTKRSPSTGRSSPTPPPQQAVTPRGRCSGRRGTTGRLAAMAR